MDAATENEPIRSKYRGLSWDKKYSGWRVRVYFAGKQRHVGRYEDEIAAAQAYDKAVVCLYGEYAVTNFGLEACLKDPTEVSVFILQAKEKAEQEQQARAQQQQLQHQQHTPSSNGSIASSSHVQPVLRHGVVPSPQGMVLSPQGITCQQHAQQQLPVQQQQLLTVDYAFLQRQLQSTGDMAFTKDCLQTQLASSRGLAGSQQCMFSAVDPSSYVLMSSPLAHSISDVSCATGTTNNLSNNVGLSSGNDTVSSSASSYMLCSTLSGQTVVLPVVQPAPSVSARSTQDASFVSPAQLQVQQQQPQHLEQHQLHQRQHRLQLPQHLQSPQRQQQQFAFLGQGEPLQLSVQPELTTIAGHMSSAAEAAGVEQQQQFLQQLEGLTLLEPAAPAYPDMFQMNHAASSSSPQLATAMQQHMQHQHPQLQANAMIQGTVMGLSPNSSMGLMPVSSVPCCAPVLDGSISWGLQQCGTSPGAITAAAAGVVSAVIPHQQQQELPLVLAMQGNSCTSAFERTSSSCSPITLASIQYESSIGRAGSGAAALHAALTNTSLQVP